jgi:hypothetical protein
MVARGQLHVPTTSQRVPVSCCNHRTTAALTSSSNPQNIDRTSASRQRKRHGRCMTKIPACVQDGSAPSSIWSAACLGRCWPHGTRCRPAQSCCMMTPHGHTVTSSVDGHTENSVGPIVPVCSSITLWYKLQLLPSTEEVLNVW